MKIAIFEIKTNLMKKIYLVFAIMVFYIIFNIILLKSNIYSSNYLYCIHDYQNSLGNNSVFIFLLLYLLRYDFNIVKLVRLKDKNSILIYNILIAVVISLNLSIIQVLCHMLIGYKYSIFIGGYFAALIYSFVSIIKLFLVLLTMSFVFYVFTSLLKKSSFVTFLLIAFFMLSSYTYSIMTRFISLLTFNDKSLFLGNEIIFQRNYTLYKIMTLIIFISILVLIHKKILMKRECL